MLATIAFGGAAEAAAAAEHPGLLNGVIRAATHPGVEVASVGSGSFNYQPSLLSWPAVRRAWSPNERRMEVGRAQVELSAKAGIPEWVDSLAGKVAGWLQLDLWTDGVPLEDAIPRIAGPFTLERNDRRAGRFVLSVTDGSLRAAPTVPPGPIDLDEFPNAPSDVAGTAQRQLILGAAPDDTPLRQIDQEGLVFYWTDGAAALEPSAVKRGQAEITTPYRMVVLTTAATGTPITALRFNESPWNTPGTGDLTCSGGIGIETNSPALSLLREFGGFDLTSRARLALETAPFAQRVLVGAQADVLSLVRDRLMLQTDGVLGFRNGRVDVLRYAAPVGQMSMALGVHLRGRRPANAPLNEDSVFNAFEMSWGSGAGGRVRFDHTYGGLVGELLATSRGLYGAREFPQLIECDDLESEAAVLALGEHLAVLMALQHRQHRYTAPWFWGLQADLNTRVMLTDAVERLTEEPCRVIETEDEITGPLLTFQTEDAGRAGYSLD